MLKSAIANLTKKIFRPKFSPGYKTRVYPRVGEMIIINDTLNFGPAARPAEIKQVNDIWPKTDMHDTNEPCDCLHDELLALCSLPLINPESGLPMINETLDVAGNTYGLNEALIEINSDSI